MHRRGHIIHTEDWRWTRSDWRHGEMRWCFKCFERDMDMLLLHVVLIVLVSEAFGLERGKNQTTENNNASTLVGQVVKSSSFRLGEEVNLRCGDVTWTNDKIMYVIWKLNIKDKDECEIRCNNEGDYKDTCQDLKVLRNSTEDRPILHIPNFSYSDVGNYSCETPYTGGSENFLYYINIIAPPNISSWLEQSGDRTVAVCRAERASPAATIRWAFTDNDTMETMRESDGLITVTSSVKVNTPEEAQNTSCTISHPYWEQPRVLVPNINNSQTISQNSLAIYTTIVISVLFCLALLILGIKKVIHLRMNQTSSKPPPVDYVEEVEPYESYVQRVNTIYNSSRELFA